MKSPKKLALFFNIESGEGRPVALLFLLYFFMGAAYSFTQASAFPMFLLTYGSRSLPWVYMTNALVVVAITFAYMRLSRRFSFSRMLVGNILFLILAISAFRFGLEIPSNGWVIFLLPVLFQILINFGNLAFWSLAGRLLDLRQAKRLFGLVGGGQWAAIVLTGFLIPPIVYKIGISNLLLLAAGSMIAVFAVLSLIIRGSSQLEAGRQAGVQRIDRSDPQPPLNRYLLSIFSLILLWWVGYYFIDNLFYGRLAVQFPDEDQLAGFLGYYLSGQALLVLIINTLLAGPVLKRYGVRLGLLILPIGLFVVTAASAVSGAVLNSAILLLSLAVASKLINMGLGFSIDLSSQNIMYQPLPPQQRARAKTLADGVVQPLGNGLAGLMLLLLSTVMALELTQLSFILLIIIAGWLVAVILLNREYPQMLRSALAKCHLIGQDLSLTDETSVTILVQELENPHPGVVLFSMDTLATARPEALETALPSLLTNPESEVRSATLKCLDRIEMRAAQQAVRQFLRKETDPSVRGTGLRTLAALSGPDAAADLLPHLHDPDPNLQSGAIVGLIRSCGLTGASAAGQVLLEMSRSQMPEERRRAAQITGEVGLPNFSDPLVPHLADPDPGVRKAAIRSAGQIRDLKLVPQVIEALKTHALSSQAAAVLVEWGEAVLPQIFDSTDPVDQDEEFLRLCIELVGRIGGKNAEAWLLQKMGHPRRSIRIEVLRSLRRCGYQAGKDERAGIEDQIRGEAHHAGRLLAGMAAASGELPAPFLRQALQEDLDQCQARIFDLLSFLYDPQAISQARSNLTLSSKRRRAYALEVLDVLIPQSTRSWLSPVWSDEPVDQKLEQLGHAFPVRPMDLEGWLREILCDPEGRYSAICVAFALQAVATYPFETLSECVLPYADSPQPLLRETAGWTCSKLQGSIEDPLPQSPQRDPESVTPPAARADSLKPKDEGAIQMLTTLEKVIALKRAPIFSSLPNQTLAAVAVLMDEIWFEQGGTVFKKDELGDCMYIIIQGKVRVHDGEVTLNFLEDGDVFGEMAVLDSEARMASVEAMEDTCLLRLDQEPLYELLQVQPGVAQGLIRTLSRHLRARIQDLNLLRTQSSVSG